MILAGIVTYNPDIQRLCENINACKKQVDKILIVDNFSLNINEIIKIIDNQIEIIFNNENRGIAYGLNQIHHYALSNNYEWFLTLDQDSVIYDELISKYNNYVISEKKKIGILTCIIRDRNDNRISAFDFDSREVTMCITSGSYCNTQALNNVGGFDTDLFIDMVDLDICTKLTRSGYVILQLNYIGLLHELGKCKNYKMFGQSFTIFNETALRWYYISRNMVYLDKNMKIRCKKKWFIYLFKIFFFENEKIPKIKNYVWGFIDGKLGNMGKCQRKIL